MNKDLFDKRNALYGPRVAAALEKRHFEAYYCATKEEALEKAMSLIPKGDVIGWGGSLSVKEVGLADRLYEEGYTILDRDKATSPEERIEIMRKALLCDTFVTSSNAVTEDGQLFNIDGMGNRVSAMTFGPKSVVVIAGINKVVKDIHDAWVRVQSCAAPLNMQRFEGSKTPCYVTGSCGSCMLEESICCHCVTTRLCRPKHRIKVIIVGEELGL